MRSSQGNVGHEFDFFGLNFQPPQDRKTVQPVTSSSRVDRLPIGAPPIQAPRKPYRAWKKLLIASVIAALLAGYVAYRSSHREGEIALQSPSLPPSVLPPPEDLEQLRLSSITAQGAAELEARTDLLRPMARPEMKPSEGNTKSAQPTNAIEDGSTSGTSAPNSLRKDLPKPDTWNIDPRAISMGGRAEPEVRLNSSGPIARSKISSAPIGSDKNAPRETQPIEQGATTDETSATTASQQSVHPISPAFDPAWVALPTQSKNSQPEQRQLIASSQVSVCYLSASAVRQEHPQARPSWTLHALGHEGTKCWYPAIGPKGDPKSPSN